MQIRCNDCGTMIETSHNQKIVKCPKCRVTIKLSDKNSELKITFNAVEKAFGKKAAQELDKNLKLR